MPRGARGERAEKGARRGAYNALFATAKSSFGARAAGGEGRAAGGQWDAVRAARAAPRVIGEAFRWGGA